LTNAAWALWWTAGALGDTKFSEPLVDVLNRNFSSKMSVLPAEGAVLKEHRI
jgi:hypothetical protein